MLSLLAPFLVVMPSSPLWPLGPHPNLPQGESTAGQTGSAILSFYGKCTL
jgi:hypothetical protein